MTSPDQYKQYRNTAIIIAVVSFLLIAVSGLLGKIGVELAALFSIIFAISVACARIYHYKIGNVKRDELATLVPVTELSTQLAKEKKKLMWVFPTLLVVSIIGTLILVVSMPSLPDGLRSSLLFIVPIALVIAYSIYYAKKTKNLIAARKAETAERTRVTTRSDTADNTPKKIVLDDVTQKIRQDCTLHLKDIKRMGYVVAIFAFSIFSRYQAHPDANLTGSYIWIGLIVTILLFVILKRIWYAKRLLAGYDDSRPAAITVDSKGMTIPIVFLTLNWDICYYLKNDQMSITIPWSAIKRWQIVSTKHVFLYLLSIDESLAPGLKKNVRLRGDLLSGKEKELFDMVSPYLAVPIEV